MTRYKYPSTLHLPWSEGVSRDDKVLKSLEHFKGKEIVVTEKMDGENTTLTREYFHARSVDSRHHPSRDWVSRFHAQIKHLIPEGWRVCGENLYAKHSVEYKTLRSYFLGFSVWNSSNRALSWDDTLAFFKEVGIVPVPELYRGEFNEKIIQKCWIPQFSEFTEGYVVRLCEEFWYKNFEESIAKFVRKGHVQTDEHWMHSEIIKNGLIRN